MPLSDEVTNQDESPCEVESRTWFRKIFLNQQSCPSQTRRNNRFQILCYASVIQIRIPPETILLFAINNQRLSGGNKGSRLHYDDDGDGSSPSCLAWHSLRSQIWLVTRKLLAYCIFLAGFIAWSTHWCALSTSRLVERYGTVQLHVARDWWLRSSLLLGLPCLRLGFGIRWPLSNKGKQQIQIDLVGGKFQVLEWNFGGNYNGHVKYVVKTSACSIHCASSNKVHLCIQCFKCQILRHTWSFKSSRCVVQSSHNALNRDKTLNVSSCLWRGKEKKTVWDKSIEKK